MQLVFLIGLLLFLTLSKMTGVFRDVGVWVIESWIPWWSMLITVIFTVLTGVVYALNATDTSTD